MKRIFVYELPNVNEDQLSEYIIKDIQLSYYERQKARQKIEINDEIELIIILTNKAYIKPFSYIYIDSYSKIAYRIVPAEEECLIVEANNPVSILLLGHILGNMHLPIGILENKVATIYDPTVEYKLKKYGFKTQKMIIPFLELSENIHVHE